MLLYIRYETTLTRTKLLKTGAQPQQQQQQITTNSTSSMSSTPTSSASQSPPSSKTATEQSSSSQQQMAVDLSKAYYSRDEVMRAIESLKDRYLKESSSPSAAALEAAMASKQTSSSRTSASTTIVRDIECLNSKLAELQAEISRLTLLQQRQQQSAKSNRSTAFNVDMAVNKEQITPSAADKSEASDNGLNQQPGLYISIFYPSSISICLFDCVFYYRWIVFYLVWIWYC